MRGAPGFERLREESRISDPIDLRPTLAALLARTIRLGDLSISASLLDDPILRCSRAEALALGQSEGDWVKVQSTVLRSGERGPPQVFCREFTLCLVPPTRSLVVRGQLREEDEPTPQNSDLMVWFERSVELWDVRGTVVYFEHRDGVVCLWIGSHLVVGQRLPCHSRCCTRSLRRWCRVG